MAELRTIIAELRREAAPGGFDRQLRREIARAAIPFAPLVRASILNIDTTGTRHTGLRLRIAACVQTWAEVNNEVISVGVEVNSALMVSGEKSLPLYMEGVKAPWRHPLFGDRAYWYSQAAHPYFYKAMAAFGPASRLAIDRALQQLTNAISG